MSGAAGMRGYLLQTLVSLLDGLSVDSEWIELGLEPQVASEKVDILWVYPAYRKAVQVKSSQNQIGKPDAETWAAELERSISANEYELLLLGPCSQSVVELGYVGRVKIPTPRILDPLGLIEQSAHRLDRYLEGKGISKVPAFARELIVNGLITKLELYSTQNMPISRTDFDKLLGEWILVLYPRSLNDAVSMQCDLLLDTIVFPVPTAPSHDSLAIVLPLVFVNTGVRTSVIEWLALKAVGVDHVKLYTPAALVDMQRLMQGRRALHAENVLGTFSEFVVPHGGTFAVNVLFSQEENNTQYPFRPWEPGMYTLQVYVKYRDKEIAVKQKEMEVAVDLKLLTEYKNGNSLAISIRSIVI